MPLLVSLLAVGCSPEAAPVDSSAVPAVREPAEVDPEVLPPAPWFTDITADSGLDFTHVNGMTGDFYFVESTGSGGALVDYDNDGDLDVYLVQGHDLGSSSGSRPSDRLFRNDLHQLADGRSEPTFVDVTTDAGIDARGYGIGVATGDINNDGWTDLYVTNFGPNQLWRNNRDGTFVDVTDEAGATDDRWSSSASFVDYDHDGWLDLMIANYAVYSVENDHACFAPQGGQRDYCGPGAYPAEPDRLLHNRGDGTFEDVTARAGLAGSRGTGLGVVAADFDANGWIDLYVANDGKENHLWLNNGDATFEDQGLMSGSALNVDGATEASMGVVAADFDADGDADLFMTHLVRETNTFYENLGDGLFADRTRGSGLGAPSLQRTGFGTVSLDIDGDGWLDIAVANGAVTRISEQIEAGLELPLREPDQLFRNIDGRRFEEVSHLGGAAFDRIDVGRGMAAGDVDNDGDTDLLITASNSRALLLRNNVGTCGPWLGLRLVAEHGRDLLGTRARLELAGGRVLWRHVHTDGSYASASDPRLLFAAPELDQSARLRVIWPDGTIEELTGLEVGRYHRVEPGAGQGSP